MTTKYRGGFRSSRVRGLDAWSHPTAGHIQRDAASGRWHAFARNGSEVGNGFSKPRDARGALGSDE